jgi:hypothetical protein
MYMSDMGNAIGKGQHQYQNLGQESLPNGFAHQGYVGYVAAQGQNFNNNPGLMGMGGPQPQAMGRNDHMNLMMDQGQPLGGSNTGSLKMAHNILLQKNSTPYR